MSVKLTLKRYLGGTWEESRHGLRTDFDHMQSAFNQLSKAVDNKAAAGNPPSYLASNLPSGTLGDIVIATNSSVTTWGATVVGGGTDTVLTWFNGTQWTVLGV